MGDDITIGVTEIVNNIEVTAQPNDQVVEIDVIDNTDEVTLNITPTVIEINVNKGSSFARWGTIFGTLSDQEDLQDALDLKADLVDGKVPASQLPSYVDDIIEVANFAALPTVGETGKIYVTLDNNKIYRWSGSVYIEIAANNAVWGSITGTLSNQTDLQNALNGKFNNPTGNTTQYIAGDGSLITFPIAGQAGTIVREVRNTTGATLTKGTVVYISGATGNKPTVSKAIATGDSTSAQTFGLIQADIPNNANGYVVCVGDILGLDTSAFTEGTQLYLSSTTAGTYTSTKQLAPNHLVYIGVVTRSHPTQGQIEVKIQNGYELNEIHDVAIGTLANNQFLVYESSSDLWKNKSLGTVLGGTSSQFVKGDGSLDSTAYVPTSRTITINGSTQDLSANRTFNIDVGVTSFNTRTGAVTLSSSDVTTALGYTPVTQARTLTINGTTFDLSANRSWTIPAASWGSITGTLSNQTDLQSALDDRPTGNGTINYITKFTGTRSVGLSQIFDDGTNVGIGTTLPAVKLDVNGNVNIGNISNTTNNFFRIQTNKAVFSIQANGSTNAAGTTINYTWHDGGQGPLIFNRALGVETMRLDANGNVGIGTTSPSAKLDVSGTFRSTSVKANGRVYSISDSNYDDIVSTNGSLDLNFSNSAQRGYIQSYNYSTSLSKPLYFSASVYNFETGNVGIGETNPNFPLTIANGANNASIHLKRTNSPTASWYIHSGRQSNGEFSIGDDTEYRMTITSGGQVLIGTTTAFGNGLVCSDGANIYVPYVSKVNTTSAAWQMTFTNPNGQVGNILTSGSSTAYNTSSDYRLKQDLKPINGLDLVSQIKVYDYEWKVDETRAYGVLAHELQEVIPQAVSGEKDAEQMQSVDYSKLVPILVQAIQELKAEIEILKTK
jgi:hypothetical protein